MPKENKNILKYNHGQKSKIYLLFMLTWWFCLKK